MIIGYIIIMKLFFSKFFECKKTFKRLLTVILENDQYNLIKKRYRGGNFPIYPEKGLLIFLWYLSKPDALITIAEVFHVLPSTVMRLRNVFLYIMKVIKCKYIFWPRTEEEFRKIINDFTHYPGVIGAIDGCHIKIRVPANQHDSYMDRYMSHSINLMAICNANKIFTYIFVGFPGSAHDSRVFSNSTFVKNIEQWGVKTFFPNDNIHLIGDSAFPLMSWLMKPYRSATTPIQKQHNYLLSSDRVCIEHTFGILKGRWRRLQFINTYSISKAVEVVVAACVLHNFCYLNNDLWQDEIFNENRDEHIENEYNPRLDMSYGIIKRNQIAEKLNQKTL